MDGNAAGRDTAHVGVVRHRAGVALNVALPKQRFDDVNVWQMLTATAVGVVHDEDVTRRHFSTILQCQVLHRIWKSAKLYSQG